jgi:hypothetical protein
MKEMPINIDDFQKLSPLVKGYELRPDCAYLIICDGKDFSRPHAEALMRDVMQMHPDLSIAIVATTKPKSIEVREKKNGPAEPVSGDPEAGTVAQEGSPDSEGGR